MRLVARDIHVAFGTLSVLRGASLSLAVGESIAVMGPSGSGKTTLAAVLAGLLAPSAGSVDVEWGVGEKPVALNRRGWVSFVPQTVNLFPDRTALDNVALGAVAAGPAWSSAVESAGEALDRVGLAGRTGTRASHLSGGERQRVAVARALVAGRPFVIADEPTGQLDHASTIAMLDVFEVLVERVGLLVVTHDREVAEACERQVVVRDGLLVPS